MRTTAMAWRRDGDWSWLVRSTSVPYWASAAWRLDEERPVVETLEMIRGRAEAI